MSNDDKYDNLSGEWTGIYDYPDSIDSVEINEPPVPFSAVIADQDGMISGEIIEEDTFTDHAGTRQLYAFINGERSGTEVIFTKSYNQGKDADHGIDYNGDVNGDFTEIKGVWIAYHTPEDIERYDLPPTFSGNFVMNRGGKNKKTRHLEQKEEVFEAIGAGAPDDRAPLSQTDKK